MYNANQFYEVRLSEDDRIILVKDKAVNYKAEKLNALDKITKMMRELLHIGKLTEEYIGIQKSRGRCSYYTIKVWVVTECDIHDVGRRIRILRQR